MMSLMNRVTPLCDPKLDQMLSHLAHSLRSSNLNSASKRPIWSYIPPLIHSLIAHTCALMGCTCDNRIHVVPTQNFRSVVYYTSTDLMLYKHRCRLCIADWLGNDIHYPSTNSTHSKLHTYPSLAFSDLHQPCLLKARSGTPAFAAAVAPPDLRLWKPYFLGSRPAFFSASFINSLALVYDRDPCAEGLYLSAFIIIKYSLKSLITKSKIGQIEAFSLKQHVHIR